MAMMSRLDEVWVSTPHIWYRYGILLFGAPLLQGVLAILIAATVSSLGAGRSRVKQICLLLGISNLLLIAVAAFAGEILRITPSDY
jgi:hypothetical protein